MRYLKVVRSALEPLYSHSGPTFSYLLPLVDFRYLLVKQLVSFLANRKNFGPFGTPICHSLENLVGNLRRSLIFGECIWVC